MPLSRSLSEIFGLHEQVIKHDLVKVLPATVTSVHADRQTVDCQIAVNRPIFDDLGNTYTEPAASISDVPLGVMRGGGFMVWMPVAVGDSVLLVFSDLSCDVWRAGDGTPQDPGFVGLHTHDSPFAIPMVAPDAKFFADPNNAPGKVIIGKDGSAAQIRISSTDVELGNSATKPIALAPLIDSLINAMKGAATGDALASAVASWISANWTGASPTTGSAVAKSQ